MPTKRGVISPQTRAKRLNKQNGVQGGGTEGQPNTEFSFVFLFSSEEAVHAMSVSDKRHLNGVGHRNIFPVFAAKIAQRHRAKPLYGDVLRFAHARQAPHHAVLEHPVVRLAKV